MVLYILWVHKHECIKCNHYYIAIGAISDMNKMVAQASTEQTTVASEIHGNIKKIDEFGCEVSKDASLNIKASESIANISIKLQRLVGKFNV